MSHLLAGIVLYGGIGWLLSLWLGHRSALIAVGVVVGVVLSTILVHARITHADGVTEVTSKSRFTNGGRP